MKKLNKIVLILLSIVVITQTVGTVLHEGTHWVEIELDDRVNPVKLKVYPNCGEAPACVTYHWLTNDTVAQAAYLSEYPRDEMVAKVVNIIGTTLFIILLARFMIQRGWL